MKKRVVIILTMILLFSAVTVYAGNAIYGYFNGYEKVKVLLNGEQMVSKVPGFIIENTTVLPLKTIAESMGAIVYWDEEKSLVKMIKPNVNMQLTANPVLDNGNYVIYSPFGKIPTNRRSGFNFAVYSEVDNLPNEKIQIKVVLKDPDGKLVEEGETKTFDATNEDSLQYVTPFKNIDFIKTGNYRVEFLLKSEATRGEFLKIGEKLILVK
ncbi:stalk domain-containing protein [Tepidibacillus infernus]|uniref:stalk domain-containing protein n=1 Tax=Tepidibacillus TaxID=1494427 RepID=UPI000853D0FE|nr:stalk domain-containing protein [Tepidibacillus sp. HK-1]GBF11097.1 hypothetical protein HK1_01115 [Tepidibacillus sp. HK-1]